MQRSVDQDFPLRLADSDATTHRPRLAPPNVSEPVDWALPGCWLSVGVWSVPSVGGLIQTRAGPRVGVGVGVGRGPRAEGRGLPNGSDLSLEGVAEDAVAYPVDRAAIAGGACRTGMRRPGVIWQDGASGSDEQTPTTATPTTAHDH